MWQNSRYVLITSLKSVVDLVRTKTLKLRKPRTTSTESLRCWEDAVTWGMPYQSSELLSNTYAAARARVIWAASLVEPDKSRREDWYFREPIREFNGMTAEQLVRLGKAEEVTELLRAIAMGKRGT